MFYSNEKVNALNKKQSSRRPKMHPAGNMLCNISGVSLRTGAKFFKFLKKITVIWMTIAKCQSARNQFKQSARNQCHKQDNLN